MGGALTLWTAPPAPGGRRHRLRQPGHRSRSRAEVIEMVQGMVDEGNDVMPGIGSDIADPDVDEIAPTTATPLRPLLSLVGRARRRSAASYGEHHVPAAAHDAARRTTSSTRRQRVPGQHLGGPVERDHASSAATTSPRSGLRPRR